MVIYKPSLGSTGLLDALSCVQYHSLGAVL